MQTDAELVATAQQIHLQDAFLQIFLPDLNFFFKTDGFDHNLNLKCVAVVVFKNLFNCALFFNVNDKSLSSEFGPEGSKELHLDFDLLGRFKVLPSEEDLVAWWGFKGFGRDVLVLYWLERVLVELDSGEFEVVVEDEKVFGVFVELFGD